MKQNSKKDLQFENDLLKAKLTAEFGMKENKTELEPEAENEWLNYIYEWETQFSRNQKIRVYDRIGKPQFKKFSELKPEEVTIELEKITEIMCENNILLDCICEYDDELIYKFITEELFGEEIDDIRINGMNTCFIYEEFHPNHEYDIKDKSEDIIRALFSNDTLNDPFFEHCFEETIFYDHKEFNRSDFGSILSDIQDSLSNSKLTEIKYEASEFDTDTKNAAVSGKIAYTLKGTDMIASFGFGLRYNDFYWCVNIFGIRFK